MTTEELLKRLCAHSDAAVAAQAAVLLNRYRGLIQRGQYVKAHWIHKQAWELHDWTAGVAAPGQKNKE